MKKGPAARGAFFIASYKLYAEIVIYGGKHAVGDPLLIMGVGQLCPVGSVGVEANLHQSGGQVGFPVHEEVVGNIAALIEFSGRRDLIQKELGQAFIGGFIITAVLGGIGCAAHIIGDCAVGSRSPVPCGVGMDRNINDVIQGRVLLIFKDFFRSGWMTRPLLEA